MAEILQICQEMQRLRESNVPVYREHFAKIGGIEELIARIKKAEDSRDGRSKGTALAKFAPENPATKDERGAKNKGARGIADRKAGYGRISKNNAPCKTKNRDAKGSSHPSPEQFATGSVR